MTKKEFDEKYVDDNKVIWCPTKDLASEFIALASNFGYKLKEHTACTSFDVYRCETVYSLSKTTKNITFSRFECFEYKNIIVKFEEKEIGENNIYFNEDIIVTPTEIKFKNNVNIKLTKQEFESMKRQFAEL